MLFGCMCMYMYMYMYIYMYIYIHICLFILFQHRPQIVRIVSHTDLCIRSLLHEAFVNETEPVGDRKIELFIIELEPHHTWEIWKILWNDGLIHDEGRVDGPPQTTFVLAFAHKSSSPSLLVVCVCVVYIYIYIEEERERERHIVCVVCI